MTSTIRSPLICNHPNSLINLVSSIQAQGLGSSDLRYRYLESRDQGRRTRGMDPHVNEQGKRWEDAVRHFNKVC
jgi:hypothetical protein